MTDAWRWTEARYKSVAQHLVAISKRAGPKVAKPPVVDAPFTRAKQGCFYRRKGPRVIGQMSDGTPIVASDMPQHSRARGGPKIVSTQLEPGVAVQCESYKQFELECARRGKAPK